MIAFVTGFLLEKDLEEDREEPADTWLLRGERHWVQGRRVSVGGPVPRALHPGRDSPSQDPQRRGGILNLGGLRPEGFRRNHATLATEAVTRE